MRPGTDLYWLVYRWRMVDRDLLRETSQLLDPSLSSSDRTRLTTSLTEMRLRSYLRATRPDLALPAATADLAELWQQQPLLTREDLQRTAALGPGTKTVRTGGSTGEPVAVQLTPEGFRAKRSRLLASRMAIGWRPGVPTVGIWGSDSDLGVATKRRERWRSALSQMFVDGGFRGDPNRWHSLADRLERFQEPVCLYGYTSLLEDFTRTLRDDGRTLRSGLVTSAWNGAEPITPRARDLVPAVTGAPLLNFYGARETGAVAVQVNPRFDDLTTLLPNVLVEVVDRAGTPVAEGETGRVLVSVLNSSGGTQLTRYAIGDEAVAGESFAFGHRTVRELAGRSNENIHLPDGSVVSSAFFLHAAKDFGNIREFQVRANEQRRTISIEVALLDRSDPAGDADRYGALIGRLFTQFEVTVGRRETLPRGANGKLRQVIVE